MRDPSSPTRDETRAPLRWKCGVSNTGHRGSPGKHNFYMHLETKKLCVTCFIATLTLLQWSGTEPTISLRGTPIIGNEAILPLPARVAQRPSREPELPTLPSSDEKSLSNPGCQQELGVHPHLAVTR